MPVSTEGVDTAQAKLGNGKVQTPDQSDEDGKCQVFLEHGRSLELAGVSKGNDGRRRSYGPLAMPGHVLTNRAMIPTFTRDDPEAVVTLHEYASGTVFARHAHSRGQFAYASTGAMKMFTDLGNWVVPPQRGDLGARRRAP